MNGRRNTYALMMDATLDTPTGDTGPAVYFYLFITNKMHGIELVNTVIL